MNLEIAKVNKVIKEFNSLMEGKCRDCMLENHGFLVDAVIDGILIGLNLDLNDYNMSIIEECLFSNSEINEFVVHSLGVEVDCDDACCSCGECTCGCESSIEYDEEENWFDSIDDINLNNEFLGGVGSVKIILGDDTSVEDFGDTFMNWIKQIKRQ